tara:strand:- start:497 stop:847 length:351 start_codon:yes stop_codon:yes gene_type:complete
MDNTIEVRCIKKLFKKVKYSKKSYLKTQIQAFYLDLVDYLLLNNINVLITDTSRLEEEGMCLIDLSAASEELYFVLCEFNFQSNSFKFYDFKNNKSFYSSKEVINSLSNTKCLLVF